MTEEEDNDGLDDEGEIASQLDDASKMSANPVMAGTQIKAHEKRP